MKKTRLSRRAESDLVTILSYSLRHFGQQQADAYILDLRNAIRRIGEYPSGAPMHVPDMGIRRKTHRMHLIFYIDFPDHIEIVRILDARRKVRVRG